MFSLFTYWLLFFYSLASSQGGSINNPATAAGMAYPMYNGFSAPGTSPLLSNRAPQQNTNDVRPQQQPNVAANNNQQQPQGNITFFILEDIFIFINCFRFKPKTLQMIERDGYSITEAGNFPLISLLLS